jgi:thymidylate synthase
MKQTPEDKLVCSETIGECWLSCIQKVTQNGIIHHDEDIQIHEILGLAIEISNPQCHDEIIFELGDQSVISRTLTKFSKGVEMPDRPFTYGARIFDNGGVDQFEWLVERLQSKREAKSATFGLLNPGCLSPNQPCLTTVDAKIRDEKLELQFFFRSQNIFGRQYANLLALAKLQADIAARCSVETGGMRGYIASAHIYAFDMAEAQRIVSGERLNIKDKYYTEGPQSIRSNTRST